MNSLSNEMIENLEFSSEELNLLEKARKMPIVFDPDCPETTPDMAIKFKRVNPPRFSKQYVL